MCTKTSGLYSTVSIYSITKMVDMSWEDSSSLAILILKASNLTSKKLIYISAGGAT